MCVATYGCRVLRVLYDRDDCQRTALKSGRRGLLRDAASVQYCSSFRCLVLHDTPIEEYGKIWELRVLHSSMFWSLKAGIRCGQWRRS